MQQTPTILIVDDLEQGRETLEALLFNQGYRLLFTNNGFEAIELAQRETLDVILLDVMMPRIDGFEVCRRIRAHTHLAEIPILMVTALDNRESLITGLESGADDFISKPFDRSALRTRVRTIKRLNRYRHLIHERARFELLLSLAPNGILLVDTRKPLPVL